MQRKDKYKKQNFTGIIVLMGVSLIGVIIIQLLWMKKAISVKEEQFNQQVSKVLTQAADRIERNQHALMLSNMVSRKPIIYKGNSNGIAIAKDSSMQSFKDYWEERSPYRKKEQKILKPNGEEVTQLHYKFDTLIQNESGVQHIQSYSSVTSSDNEIIVLQEGGNISFSTTIKDVRSELNEVVDQMILEFNTRNISMVDQISLSTIEPTIKYELKNMNIPLDFEFAVANGKDEVYEKLKSKGFSEKSMDKAYRTRLFASQLNFSSDQLLVQFPDKREFLFHSLTWLFVGSLVFTLIILATFYYSIRFLVNQKKASEVKTDFINNMTHEFKTPIATISLATDSIKNPNILNFPEKVMRFNQIISEENQRMNRQVESVLKMAMIDKKDFNLNLQSLQVHPTIEKAVQNIRLQVEQKGGSLTTDLQADNDKVRVDETHFTNLIFNLLDNANKYSLNAPPEIKISTYNQEESLYIAVEDKGIGMDKETQSKIFDKFYRVNTGDVHTVKGFGLGLSYVKVMIMAFKGSIDVKSQKGKGSTFALKIPILKY